jgi:hypothetical protein
MKPRPRVYATNNKPVAYGFLINPTTPERSANAQTSLRKHHADKRTMRAYDEAIRFPEDEEL